jgi:NADP-dependent 3-hydroxy acid dehydrogenase YdfG
MKKVIVVFGFGPGISTAVAAKFGAEGFSVALVGRTAARLEAGVAALKEKGIEAASFVADAGDVAAVRSVIERVHAELGPVTVVEWTAYGGSAGDLTTASEADLRGIFDVAVVGLSTAVQAALPDLTATGGAVLVTNGGLGLFHEGMDAVGVQWGAMGLSMANSAKHKLVRLLSLKLKPAGVYVGEVMVMGSVKGTAFDNGSATIDPAHIAEKFWYLYQDRTELSVSVS